MSGNLRLLAIVPHPDDESFFMGGTLAKYAAVAQVGLVVVTDGGMGKRARLDAKGRWSTNAGGGEELDCGPELGRVREDELAGAARELGVREIAWLGWTENLETSAQFLRSAIRQQIRSFDPHVVLTLNEAGITRHVDHSWVALASHRAILDLANDPSLSLERFYTVSLPAACDRFDYWGEILTRPDQRVEIDVADARARSLAACHRHRSQAHWVSYLDSVGLLAPDKEIFIPRWSRNNRGSNRTDLFAEPPAGDTGAPVMPMPATPTAYTSDQPDLAETIFWRDRRLRDNSMRAVILASGHGTRMNNPSLPKSMEVVAGHPMLHYPLTALSEANVDERPVVVTGPRGQPIREAFAGLEFVDQPRPLGTGHALKQSRQTLRRSGARHVCVIYGDMPMISAASIRRLASCHCESGSVLSLATIKVADFTGDRRHFKRHGRIMRDADGGITGIIEFSDADDEQREITDLNPGIYCFDTNWLWPALDRIESRNRQDEFYLTDLVSIAVADGSAVAEIIIPAMEGLGVNSREDLAVANALLGGGREASDGRGNPTVAGKLISVQCTAGHPGLSAPPKSRIGIG